MVDMSGYSKPTVVRVKNSLRQKGLLDEAKARNSAKSFKREHNLDDSSQLTDAKQLLELANSDILDFGLDSEEDTRKKLLKQVQLLALDPGVHPDTRLSATQVWVKLKDIARAKDLGPGLPRSREEIIDRLIRIMQAVGANLSITALEAAFKKENSDAEAQNVEIPTSPGASETSESTGHEVTQKEITS
jgi:hypothetical protein